MAAAETGMKPLSAATVRILTSTQVITSVVSVVKELMENSLDAMATSVDIRLDNFGFDKIEVRDNGRGIRPTDAPYMGLAHYTSKIRDHSDLDKLLTYGFRGEALGSLCAVSEVTVTTRTAEDDISTSYTLNNKGQITATKPSHLAQGTTVSANNLFKLVPVRRQYYNTSKKKKEEMRRVEELLMAYGVIRPDVRVTLRHNKDLVWQKNSSSDQRTVLLSIVGRQTMGSLEYIKHEESATNLSIEAYLPKARCDSQLTSRATPDRCMFFVNKRPVQLKEMEKVLRSRYTHACGCDSSRYPIAFVSFTLPPDGVDVNLEPNKTRVLLQKQEDVLEIFTSILEKLYGPLEEPPLRQKRDETAEKFTESETSEKSISEQRTSEEALFVLAGAAAQNEADLPIAVDCDTPEPERPPPGVSLTFHHAPKQDGGESALDDLQPTQLTFDLFTGDDDDFLFSDLGSLTDSTARTTTSDEIGFADRGSSGDTQTANQIEGGLGSTNEVQGTVRPANPIPAEKKLANQNQEDLSPCNENEENFPPAPTFHASPTNDILTDMGDCYNRPKSDTTPQQEIPLANQDKVSDHMTITAAKSATLDGPSVSGMGEVEKCGMSRGGDCFDEEAWSRGQSLQDKSGGSVEPVKLLPPTPVQRPGGHRPHFSTTPILSPSLAANRARNIVDKDQPKLYDVVDGKPVKRPITAFLFFSREIRKQLSKDHPEADFQELARLTGDKWKKLTAAERQQYENLYGKDVSRYKQELVEARIKDSTARHNKEVRRSLTAAAEKDDPRRQEQPLKKRKIDRISSVSVAERMLRSPGVKKAVAPPVREIPIQFSLQHLKDKKYSFGSSQSQSQSVEKLSVIGRLKSHDSWLGLQANHIVVLNQYRCEEMLLFHRLMASFDLPTEPLETPILLKPSMIGGEDYWKCLLALRPSGGERTNQGKASCGDPRITANGFQLQFTPDPNLDELRVEVVAMATCLPFFGLLDLREILETILVAKASTVSECRPQKVIHYLKSEAVRMARQQLPKQSCAEMSEVVKELRRATKGGALQCFHDKPIVHQLHQVPLSLTQQSSSS